MNGSIRRDPGIFAMTAPTLKQDRKLKERNITMINNTDTFAAAAFGAAALFNKLSFGSLAEPASVLNCNGSSAARVALFCEQVAEQHGRRPLWMIQNRINCHEMAKLVKCEGRQCYGAVASAIEGGDNVQHVERRDNG
jgi:hypothetical protein